MKAFVKRPLVAFAAGAAVVAVVALGGAAWAGLTSSPSTVNACIKPSNGMVYVLGMGSSRTACQPGDVAFDFNAEGVPGRDGVDGEDGEDGVSVTSRALAAGDPNCPNGGSEFMSASGITYACNGRDGVPTNELVSPNGDYKITVGDTGIRIESLVTSTEIVLSHLGITVDASNSVVVRGGTDAELRSGGQLRVQAGASVDLLGNPIRLNGNCGGVITSPGALVVQTPVTIGPDGGTGIFPSLPILGSFTVRAC